MVMCFAMNDVVSFNRLKSKVDTKVYNITTSIFAIDKLLFRNYKNMSEDTRPCLNHEAQT